MCLFISLSAKTPVKQIYTKPSRRRSVGRGAQIFLPEFSDKQITEFQEKFCENKIQIDLNDLHKLAGLDVVRERFDSLLMVREPEMKAEMDFRSLKWNTLNLNYRVKNC